MEGKMDKKNESLMKTIAEGLLAYRVYLSKCGVSGAYSEYLFYEPILRILNHRKIYTKCEVSVEVEDAEGKGKRGDKPKIDFVIYEKEKDGQGKPKPRIAFEVKFSKDGQEYLSTNTLKKDILKLEKYKAIYKGVETFIIIIGEFKNQSKKVEENLENKELFTREFKTLNNTLKVFAFKI
jgi:hypothetical protein